LRNSGNKPFKILLHQIKLSESRQLPAYVYEAQKSQMRFRGLKDHPILSVYNKRPLFKTEKLPIGPEHQNYRQKRYEQIISKSNSRIP
jgi:hypothetical protein